MDRLAEMLATQRDLQSIINGYDLDEQTNDRRIDSIKENVLALTDELHELLGEMGWKSWATSRHINHDAACGEVVDAWHFLMNIMLHLGMTAEDLHAGYLRKRAVNEARQVAGYDGVSSKCPGCGRAQDDLGVACYPGRPGATGDDSLPWCDNLKARVAPYRPISVTSD